MVFPSYYLTILFPGLFPSYSPRIGISIICPSYFSPHHPLVSHDPHFLQEKFGKLSAVVSCAGGQMMGCGLTAPWMPWWIIAEVERMVFLFTFW